MSDSGTGIPKEAIPYLFERFHRVEVARGRIFPRPGEGTGADSSRYYRSGERIGQGSVFIVSLRLGLAHLAPDRLGTDVTEPYVTAAGAAYVTEALQLGTQPSNVEHRSEFSLLPVGRTLPHAAGMPRASAPGG